jgi:hypothetical protein
MRRTSFLLISRSAGPGPVSKCGSEAWSFTATMQGWSVNRCRISKRAEMNDCTSLSLMGFPAARRSFTSAKASSLASMTSRAARSCIAFCSGVQRASNICTRSAEVVTCTPVAATISTVPASTRPT